MSLSRRRFLGTVVASAALRSTGAAASPVLTVAATTGMVADAARVVGGDRVAVQALMGPGVDPHSFRQTRSDIAAMTRADLVLWHGLYLEAQLEGFLLDLAARKPVAALGEAVPRSRLLEDPEAPGRFDPHIWMDPRLWAFAVDGARRALTEVDPDGAETYGRNAMRHHEEIAALADYADAALGSVPQEARVLVTSHDAFGYLGAAWGFEVLGVQGISTEAEAGLARIEDLVKTLVSRRIGAVFVETSVSPRNLQALVEGAAAQGHEVRIGGELFSDAMGPEGTYEGTYVGMIDHNVTTIARALGGQAPAAGLNGLLRAQG
ncbi:MAG: metal ABC transporter solute-binding protein, Zn/Mn family [Rubrimonas sp.]|uniref:metal ABC transporter solute-binding protein, Zn/Mn family n=1 Tax=Rubrimonas sp. TaxID=2036015 RepID=UPI002FDCE06B